MTAFTQADIDAAEKRGRAIGAANATRNFSDSLPEAIRIQKEAAWDEGFTRGFYDVLAGADRDACESAATNPYRPTTTEES